MKVLVKKMVWITSMMAAAIIARPQRVQAQVPIVGLFTSAIKKAITAIDISVQKMQNKIIALQNAQRQLENSLSLGRLNDISGWLNKEKDLYEGYYQELAQVRQVLSDYSEVRQIISRQKQLLSEYRDASALFHADKHFSAEELSYMDNIYGGIMQESIRNLNEVLLTVSSFSTQMDDAERLQRIHHASAGMQTNLDHLRQFNRQNAALSLTRARDEQERLTVKRLYGLL
jgi:hypothetical protein